MPASSVQALVMIFRSSGFDNLPMSRLWRLSSDKIHRVKSDGNLLEIASHQDCWPPRSAEVNLYSWLLIQ